MIRGPRTHRSIAVAFALLVGTGLVTTQQNIRVGAVASPDVTQVDLLGPAGSSDQYGETVTMLSNGNFVVADPSYDIDLSTTDVGAVHLYSGLDNTLIATLTGTKTDDKVASGGVVEVANGNYVVVSPEWSDGSTLRVGAATWIDGSLGVDGPVSTSNSLHGRVVNDRVGKNGVTALANGNYVVASSEWDNGGVLNVGAATWGNGATGTTGEVTAANSLHGTALLHNVGSAVTALTNGNYVVQSPGWDGVVTSGGAATWGNGATGTTGEVTTSNSLYGTTAEDRVGSVTALSNGNYVAVTRNWDGVVTNGGAATWGNGKTGISGKVDISNSLYGTTAEDRVGIVTPLTNGNYVVVTPDWNNDGKNDVGAVTFGSGSTGISGQVTTTNSLHGSTADDKVGNNILALTNGNYVTTTTFWDNAGVMNVGAATWGSGSTAAPTGAVTTTNSLHGVSHFDRVGSGAVALTNGNYVVRSPLWNGSAGESGAATWANGTTGITGPVTTANSLYGPTASSSAATTATALTNGNYVVVSPGWDLDGATVDVGAVTWGNGTTGITGPVTAGNSLHGTSASDKIGQRFMITDPVGAVALSDGNYVVRSEFWDLDGATADVGAVTWGDGATGATTGPVSTANSLHGVTTNDAVGSGGLTPMPDGDYAVTSPAWDRVGTAADTGAVTLGTGLGGVVGPITLSNSAVGTAPGDVLAPGATLTPRDVLPIPTEQARVLLMQIDRPPSFTSTQADITVATAPGASTTTVTFTNPTATDLLSTPTVTCSPSSGSSFAVGSTTVTCTATDSTGLTATSSFEVTVTATPPDPTVPPTTVPTMPTTTLATTTTTTTTTTTATPPTGPSVPVISSLSPERFLDTRPGGITFDGSFQAIGKRSADTELQVRMSGRGSVPTDARAVVLNVTAVGPEATGFVAAHPCASPRPLASSLNHTTAVNLGNEIIAPVTAAGDVCLYTSAATHLTADVTGFVAAGSPLVPITPERFLDTRPNGMTIDDVSEAGVRPTAGSTTRLMIAGRGQVPADASSAIVNITAIGADNPGFVTVHPCLDTPPNAASLNYVPRVNRGNELVATLNGAGQICIFTSAGTHLAADVVGYLPAGSDLTAVDPGRLLDTRPTGVTVDGLFQAEAKRGASAQLEVQVGGRHGIPANATAAIINVTAVGPDGTGFITIHPCTTPRPNTASLNHTSAVNGGNEIITRLSSTGTICLYTSASTHLTADVVAYTT